MKEPKSAKSDFSAGENLDSYDIMPTSRAFNRFTLRSHVRGICNGNYAAGAVLDFLLFRHKLKVSLEFSKGTVKNIQDMETAQRDGLFDMYHTKESMHSFFDGLYSKPTLVGAEKVLLVLGYIKIYKKRNKNNTDNTNHYHLNGDVLRDALAHYWECFDNGITAVFPLDENSPSLKTLRSIVKNLTVEQQEVNEHSLRIRPKDTVLRIESTTTGSCRDEGQNPPSSGPSYSANHLAVNQALNATRSNNTPANSRQRKPRRPPAPLPSHPAIPFMQELARTLAPVLATPAHADYPSEGVTAFKYHTDALEAYDAIQTGAIMARTIDRPERYTDPTIWGNDFRMAQLKQWAKDPKAMEAALLSAARIFATSRAKNTTVAKLPNVAAFLFGSTTSGGFLPWWSAIKPVEAMEAKEKQILKEADLEEKSKPRWLELEEKNRIERNSFYHRHFVKMFGREPKQFKETK